MYIACKVGTGDCQGIAADSLSADHKGSRELDGEIAKACAESCDGRKILCLDGEVKLGSVGKSDVGYGFNLLRKGNCRHINRNLL